MRRVSRRTFLAALAATLPTALAVRLAHAAAVDDLVERPETLLALGEVVLPTELGPGRLSASVEGFRRWMTGYREGAELVHGYGTSNLERTGPTPVTRWVAQLDALDRAAERAQSRSFATLSFAQRQELVRAELDGVKADRIPPIARCPHVALALLSHFYNGSAATDLCYDAQILRENCRPLASSTRKPLPLARAGRT